MENDRPSMPLTDPDYAKVFVTRSAIEHDGIDQIFQTAVGLDEVLTDLSGDDTCLRDAVLTVVRAN